MDLHPYSHNCFSKISRPFFASRNLWIIVVFLQFTLIEKSPFVLINTLLLHIPLLALTHRQKEWQTEKRIHLLRMNWRKIFQLCCCVSFLVVAEIFSFRRYLPSIPVVPLCLFFVSAGNSFWLHRSVFLLWREIVLGVTSLPTIPVVPLCQFFGCGRK